MFLLTGVGGCLASTAALCACQACTCVSKEVLRKSARLAYCVLFFFALCLAWVLRDFAKPLIEKIPWIFPGSGFEPSDRWYGQQAVYRLSMGNFMFFGLMSLVLVGVKFKSDKRDQYLHHGNWLVKLGLWLIFSALPFFFPNSVINAYGWAARVGSGVFLVVQMVILLDLTQAWNDNWVAQDDENYLYGLLGVTVGAYLGAAGLVAWMLYWFNPQGAGDCSFNITMIVFTILIGLCVSLLSLHPSAQNGSLFPAAIISIYCTYLCYSALQSEPHDYACNALGHKIDAASGSTLALGMAITLASVVYSALRAGSNTQTFMGSGEADTPLLARTEEGLTSAGLDGEPPSQPSMTVDAPKDKAMADYEAVSYSYSFFHLVFALASMYIAMLMTGWGMGAEEKDLIDVGWASVWVKLASQWGTALLYAWTLIAPALFPDREFS